MANEAPAYVLESLKKQAQAVFRAAPLNFFEEPDEEYGRLQLLQKEDPIALQDVLNTSQAFVQAVRDRDLEELRRVVKDAESGELLQVFVLQALIIAVRGAMLDIVKEMINWGVPLKHEVLSQALHLTCEIVNRDNFSDAWRIVELLIAGNEQSGGGQHIDAPRSQDGWTPLCIACNDACLPLAFKLLELKADPNVITRKNETPLALAKRQRGSDNDEQAEARGIICNMLKHYGGQERWQDALAHTHTKTRFKPPPRPAGAKPASAIKAQVLPGHSEAVAY
eukprot:TRINITY_DN3472_c0_g1_i2.p1 TRINITY_DN3472_c0_g1~~TRINITY_DN3472_c0_g1_i2.p1  ORF type:complete len:281 (+),score=73.89 TRINITY_DN3472_c0_g1_i2:80-922(+)